ncbi:TetR/AcrR family transcriptional regulator [Corallococcus sp. H22C18031201]|uniref:TetR/AcrR family transcriptional regulator n=1 Tax=Citreicoccus inhibens TaxID=2849499 RepID=UPI000E74D1E8|nr:TetR/AcrR family transcriptional regulator C-terminal domain-containing protein [Citreicoccus inhibens]MBU8899110.1 TetR/AcrR family transcriptional regulator [Citreicoccus inhibens]RJS14522.1 TetR/AcrR family transcriptional regulator [Corallococcus sp. H22C18031201]
MSQKPREPETALIWERPEPAPRPKPEPLSRERIVRAALTLADTEGLASVSVRKVAAALDAGPMRLYGYVSTKEELLELMVDAVYGELVAEGPLRGSWREALRAMAQRTRRAAHAHPWLVDLLVGRIHLGPHALAYLEAALAALDGAPGFETVDAILQAVGTVNAFVIGAIRNEASERSAERESGMTKKEWQHATSPYLERMVATGRFPMLGKVMREATHPSFDVAFDQGLDCILEGLATRLPRRKK